MRITAAAITISITLLALLASCGQTGPLYHPGTEPVRGQQSGAGEPVDSEPTINNNSAAEAP